MLLAERCRLPPSVFFHWFNRVVAPAWAKCSQLPVGDASVPDGMNAFCDRFA